MNFSNGRIHRALPGPSIIPDKVLQAMQRPAPNIYGGELEEITMNILSDISGKPDYILELKNYFMKIRDRKF